MSKPVTESAPGIPAAAQPAFDLRIWLLALGTFAVGTDNLVIAGILPVLSEDLGVDAAGAGQLVTAYALAYGAGSPFLAAFTGRWRRDRVVAWAIGGFAVANLVCAAAPNYAILMAARVLAAGFAALYTPSAYALAVSMASPERRGRALSTVLLGISASTVFGVPLGAVIGHRLGWHMTFVFVAALSAIATAALAWMRTGAAAAGSKLSLRERLAPLTRPLVLLALLPGMTWIVGVIAVFTYIVPMLSPHFDRDTIVLLLLVNGVGGLVGSILGGRLVDRYGPVRPIIVGLLVGVANYFVWGSADGAFALTAVAVFVYATAGWAIGPSQQTRVIRLDPNNAAVTLALNNATMYVGNATGAALGGIVIGFAPAEALIYVAMILNIAALFALVASVRMNRRFGAD